MRAEQPRRDLQRAKEFISIINQHSIQRFNGEDKGDQGEELLECRREEDLEGEDEGEDEVETALAET